MVGNISQVATFTIKEFFMGKICSRDANGNVQVAQENQQLFKQAKQDFREEAEILHALKHANIVPVNEVLEQHGLLCDGISWQSIALSICFRTRWLFV